MPCVVTCNIWEETQESVSSEKKSPSKFLGRAIHNVFISYSDNHVVELNSRVLLSRSMCQISKGLLVFVSKRQMTFANMSPLISDGFHSSINTTWS